MGLFVGLAPEFQSAYRLWLNRAQVHALRTFNTRCVYRGERLQMYKCILSSGQVWRRCGHRFNYSWPAQSARERSSSAHGEWRVTYFVIPAAAAVYVRDACAGPRPLRLIFKCSSLHKTYAVLEGTSNDGTDVPTLHERALWTISIVRTRISLSARCEYICINYCASD